MFHTDVNFVNLTPHSITIVDGANTPVLTIPASGTLARCTSSRVAVGNINGIVVNRTSFGAVTGLPDPIAGTIFIVSAIVAQAVAGTRTDIVIVDDTVRDTSGAIIGCRAFAVI